MEYVRLGDFCEITSSKRVYAHQYTSDGVPFYRSREIIERREHKYITEELYISSDLYNTFKQKFGVPQKGDILLTSVGTLGIPYLVGEEVFYFKDGNLTWMRNFNESLLSKYLFYWFNSKFGKDSLITRAIGSSQAALTIDILKKYKFILPSINVQQTIISILSSYDELIEKNNKRIKILEQMAENLYKEWFVRFRFPGYEQAEFENGIPKGWKACKLREIIRIRYGKDHKDLEDGTIPVFGSGGVMRYGNRALYSGETVMIPRKGSLHNVTYYKGDLWTVDTMFYTEFKVPTCASYLYFTLSQFDLESLNKGASIPSLSTDILYNLKIVLPPQWLLTQFQQMIDVLNAQTEKLTQQNYNLTKQRDMLLPRLMSGKLEV